MVTSKVAGVTLLFEKPLNTSKDKACTVTYAELLESRTRTRARNLGKAFRETLEHQQIQGLQGISTLNYASWKKHGFEACAGNEFRPWVTARVMRYLSISPLPMPLLFARFRGKKKGIRWCRERARVGCLSEPPHC